MDQQENRDKITKFIQKKFAANVAIDADTSLMASRIIESVNIFELVEFLEREFNVRFKDTDLNPDHFDSINKIIALISKSRS